MNPRIAYVASKEPVRLEAVLQSAKPDLEVDVIEAGLPEREKAARCAPHEIIIVGARTPMSVLLSCDRLRFVQLMSAGFDAYDVGALGERGVQIANNAAAIAPTVAEHTILLMLAVKRRLVESWLSVQSRDWDARARKNEMTELTGSTVGVIGLGHIGRQVAKRLRGWEVKLLYFDPVPAPPEVEQELGATRVGLDELLRGSDVVTLHVPLNARTRHLIGESELRMMKSTAILVNTCRGPVVDERALCAALANGWIMGAGLDVLAVEPADPDNPLLEMGNALVTPHAAGSSIQRAKRTAKVALANVRRVLKGLSPLGLLTAAHTKLDNTPTH